MTTIPYNCPICGSVPKVDVFALGNISRKTICCPNNCQVVRNRYGEKASIIVMPLSTEMDRMYFEWNNELFKYKRDKDKEKKG